MWSSSFTSGCRAWLTSSSPRACSTWQQEDQGDPDELPYILFSARLEDGTRIAVSECASRLPFTVPLDDGYQLPGTRLLVIDGRYIETVQGQPIELSLEVLDRNGRYAVDQRRVVPVVLTPPPGPR